MESIKKTIIKKIQKSTRTKAALSYAFNKGIRSIDRWLIRNEPVLTTSTALNIISRELNIEKSEILTNE